MQPCGVGRYVLAKKYHTRTEKIGAEAKEFGEIFRLVAIDKTNDRTFRRSTKTFSSAGCEVESRRTLADASFGASHGNDLHPFPRAVLWRSLPSHLIYRAPISSISHSGVRTSALLPTNLVLPVHNQRNALADILRPDNVQVKQNVRRHWPSLVIA